MDTTPTEEWVERQRVVAVARSWERTPYRHMGRIKGAGADCLTLLAEVFYEARLTPKIEIPFYPQDFMMHRAEERYLEGILQYSKEIFTPPQPGDIVLWKVGRCFSHGAIVVAWPIIIHAQTDLMVMLDDALATAWLTHIGENSSDQGKPRPMKTFSYWAR